MARSNLPLRRRRSRSMQASRRSISSRTVGPCPAGRVVAGVGFIQRCIVDDRAVAFSFLSLGRLQYNRRATRRRAVGSAGPLPQTRAVFWRNDMATPAIRTTVVGSYPVPDWLAALPSQQSLIDATRVVFKIQEMAGIDVVVDGELYRFDVNHPDTNGMIEYFIRPMSGIRSKITRADILEFSKLRGMGFRAEPAGVVEGPIGEGTLNLLSDYRRARAC